jgi:hypothetical protein
MLNSGEKKNSASRDQKNKYSYSCVVRKKFLNETKNHNPPLQVKWSVPKSLLRNRFFLKIINKQEYNELNLINQLRCQVALLVSNGD